MPGKKKTFRKKTVKGKPKRALVAAVAKTVQKKMMEHKYIDFVSQGGGGNGYETVSYGGSIHCLTLCAQGTDVANRIGDQIVPISLHLRGRVIGNGANQSNVCRVIIFQDKISNGAVPNVADILETTGSNMAPFSLQNQRQNGRFSIKYDKVFDLTQQALVLSTTFAAGNGSISSHVFNRFLKLRGHIRFQGTSANQGDALMNHLYLLLISDVNTNDPSIAWTSRVTFEDA